MWHAWTREGYLQVFSLEARRGKTTGKTKE
jgi:hypothetical protein